ncbi:5'-nucleotidase SurE [Posidoniimonas polymericola]|uniref:5'-nucleotidase SurE n=1 Tax=Posidoniimonas polymericola TaxID=2528002 RepID=A0A5C5YSH3_9BACT|nr:5'/3'-nucleotidase SurE [Posidoniimonas polymericola]TWT77710.1 5'-nucleotidase SurE [Posidoniimonas polymericola]
MKILLTNDDGIYAPGMAAMRAALEQQGDEVCVVAPAIEQSGVGHSITFLTPLMAKEVYSYGPEGDARLGWGVEGSPADCVKLAIGKLCPWTPDLVVSGINGGLNVGVNVLYSGTVAAATEAAMNGVPSLAVSLEYDEHARFHPAARLATRVIRVMHERNAWADHLLYNLNIPTTATLDSPGNSASGGAPAPELRFTGMNTYPWAAEFEARLDPKNRHYYWATGSLPVPGPTEDSDLAGIRNGCLTLTPLSYDRTEHDQLEKMRGWEFDLSGD